MNFRIVILALLILISSRLGAQRNYLFENISISEGLSNKEVEHIFQDSNGFLWVSTVDGLNRYNGHSIKVFKNDRNDSTTLANNYCSAITEDTDGYIWVSHLGGSISRFDPIDESFKTYLIQGGNLSNVSEFYSALTDSKGNVWFTSSNLGVQKLNKSEDRFEKIVLDANKNGAVQWGQIHHIIELKNGTILAPDFQNGIMIYNEKLNLFQPYYLKGNFSPDGIMKMFEDFSGNIWFGGSEQLIKYSPVYYTIVDDFFNSAMRKTIFYDFITGIQGDADGFIWFTIFDAGLYRLDPKTAEIKKYDFSSEQSILGQKITDQLYKDSFGVFWMGTWFNGLYRFDPLREPFSYTKFESKEIVKSGVNNVTTIAGLQQDKEILIGTNTQGLFSFNLKNKKAVKVRAKLDPATILDGIINVQQITKDDKGNIWFSYNNLGLFKLNKNLTAIPVESPHKNKTTVYNANDLKMDSAGNIWIASRYGFEKYNPVTKVFSLLPTEMNKQMSEGYKKIISQIPESREPIASILKVGEAFNSEKEFVINQDQKVLVLCVGEGRIVGGSESLFDTGSLLSDKNQLIWSMNNFHKTFYSGGGFKNRIGVKCVELKKGTYKLTYASDVGHSYGNWNVVPPSDSLWWGIQILPISDAEFYKIKSINDKEINVKNFMPMEVGTTIEISKRMHNVLWLGSSANGFFKYDLATGIYKQFNFDEKNKFSGESSISILFEDRDGIVWGASQSNLFKLNPETEQIETFDQKDGLPSNNINTIVEDLQGNLWINTTGGLAKLNKSAPKENWNFVNFDLQDGLQDYGIGNASWISKDGEIIFGGINGVISFYPGRINTTLPDIVIEDIKISDVSIMVDSANVYIDESIPKLEKLNLTHTQNNISFEFSSIHFSRPAKNKVQYRLAGFDSHWKSTERNFASFTNLDPGEYTFHVKGSNGDGIWNDEGKSIRITISSPWWQTGWAYTGYVLIFGLLIFAIDRIQRARISNEEKHKAELTLLEAENKRKSEELEEARQLQLSMLPKELPQLPHLDIAVYMQTATEVGGDYYDFHVGLDGTLTVVIGDATGHGMKAGTMVTTAKTLFKSYASNPDILFSFQEFTRCIKEMNMGKLSMCLTMLKIKGGKMQISTAGMPPSFIFREDTKVVEEHLFKAMPLGTMLKFPYEVKDTTLKTGDTILLMSDGLPELQNDKEEMYGYKRIRNGFEDVAEKAPDEIISFLKNEGSVWNDNQAPDDDVTFVVIKVK